MSYLVHFVSVWASTYPTNLNRIVILQKNVQLSNKQILFNTFDDSLPMQMPNSTQSKLCLLVLLQKKYLYTCKNIVTKPDLDEFLSKLFELFIVICFVTYLLTNSFIYLFFYFVLCIKAVNLFSIKKILQRKLFETVFPRSHLMLTLILYSNGCKHWSSLFSSWKVHVFF